MTKKTITFTFITFCLFSLSASAMERIGSIYDTVFEQTPEQTRALVTCIDKNGDTVQLRLSTVEYIILLLDKSQQLHNCSFK